MGRKSFVMVALLAVWSFVGVAECADNSSVTQGKEGSSLSGTASNFEGIWSGAFTLGMGGTRQQEITITIGEKGPKGYNKVTYGYGWGRSGGNDVPPGSFVVYGRERGGFFYFGWKDKAGAKKTIKMGKIKDDVAKVRLDHDGETAIGGAAYYEGTFTRK